MIFLEKVISMIDNTTIFIAMSDHGMTLNGDHGGHSPEEVDAFFFAHTKGRPFLPLCPWKKSNRSGYDADILQTSFAPTLSYLLGTATPFSSIGYLEPALLPISESAVSSPPSRLSIEASCTSSSWEAPPRSVLDPGVLSAVVGAPGAESSLGEAADGAHTRDEAGRSRGRASDSTNTEVLPRDQPYESVTSTDTKSVFLNDEATPSPGESSTSAGLLLDEACGAEGEAFEELRLRRGESRALRGEAMLIDYEGAAHSMGQASAVTPSLDKAFEGDPPPGEPLLPPGVDISLQQAFEGACAAEGISGAAEGISDALVKAVEKTLAACPAEQVLRPESLLVDTSSFDADREVGPFLSQYRRLLLTDAVHVLSALRANAWQVLRLSHQYSVEFNSAMLSPDAYENLYRTHQEAYETLSLLTSLPRGTKGMIKRNSSGENKNAAMDISAAHETVVAQVARLAAALEEVGVQCRGFGGRYEGTVMAGIAAMTVALMASGTELLAVPSSTLASLCAHPGAFFATLAPVAFNVAASLLLFGNSFIESEHAVLYFFVSSFLLVAALLASFERSDGLSRLQLFLPLFLTRAANAAAASPDDPVAKVERVPCSWGVCASALAWVCFTAYLHRNSKRSQTGSFYAVCSAFLLMCQWLLQGCLVCPEPYASLSIFPEVPCDRLRALALLWMPRAVYSLTAISVILTWLRPVATCNGYVNGAAVCVVTSCCLLLGSRHAVPFLLFLQQMYALRNLLINLFPPKHELHAASDVSCVSVAVLAGHVGFFMTGHACAFSALHYDAAFVGFEEFMFGRSGLMLATETFVTPLATAALVLFPLDPKSTEQASSSGRRALLLMWFHLVRLACTACVAFVQREHVIQLQLFTPRFVFELFHASIVGLALSLFFMLCPRHR
eukprot:Rmarinus@m.5002